MTHIVTIGDYKIDFAGNPPGGLIKNAGYRIYKASYQTHRAGRPIKTPSHKRRHRWALVSVHPTEQAAREELARLHKTAEEQKQ